MNVEQLIEELQRLPGHYPVSVLVERHASVSFGLVELDALPGPVADSIPAAMTPTVSGVEIAKDRQGINHAQLWLRR